MTLLRMCRTPSIQDATATNADARCWSFNAHCLQFAQLFANSHACGVSAGVFADDLFFMRGCFFEYYLPCVTPLGGRVSSRIKTFSHREADSAETRPYTENIRRLKSVSVLSFISLNLLFLSIHFTFFSPICLNFFFWVQAAEEPRCLTDQNTRSKLFSTLGIQHFTPFYFTTFCTACRPFTHLAIGCWKIGCWI